MSSYGASTTKRTRRSRDDVSKLDHALYDIVKADPPMTVRQVFYQATVRGLVPKDETKGYRVVQRRLVILREVHVLPYDWITDNVRMVRGLNRYNGIDDFATQSAQLYRRDYWSRSSVRVEVWLEKDALAGVLYPTVVAEWGLELFVTRGFPSISYVQSAAEVSRLDGRPTFIYVLTDLDPSGIGIAQKIGEELSRRAEGVEMTVRRLAVTPEQVAAMDLPTRPTKKTDTRAKKFEAEYGTNSVELDAIPPSVLRILVSSAIAQHADTDEHKRLKQIEQLERSSLVRGLWGAS